MQITTKRVYDAPSPDDGLRILVDRLWPRGLTHERVDAIWDKDVAPSTELRQWFHADTENRWTEFQTRYRNELEVNPAFASLKTMIHGKPKVTLLYASHDTTHNEAVVLQNLLKS